MFISTYFCTSCCTLFCMSTVLESSVYYNDQNIVYLYGILLQMTSFGFTRVVHLRVDSILCTPPLVRGGSSFLHILVQITAFSRIFNFRNCSVLISKLHKYFTPLFYHIFPVSQKKRIKRTNLYKTCVGSLCF